MAMEMPSVKPRTTMPDTFEFQEDSIGLGNIAVNSMTARDQIAPRHPLEKALQDNSKHQEALQRSVLLASQGPAGPLIYNMELRSVNSVGRLPFLQGSNFQRDVLTGKDEEIDFDDVFALYPRFSEHDVHPHTVMDMIANKLSF